MKIAVTGANGRVGSAVVDLAVAQGHEVVAIDRTPSSLGPPLAGSIQIDMADFGKVVTSIAGCDAVIHLAAINGPGRDPADVVHNNNVVASYNALLAAAEAGITRVCQASSVNAIGGRFSVRARYDYFPVDEHHPAYPEDPYSLSKWICEQQADAIVRKYPEMSVASLRLHGIVDEKVETERWHVLPPEAIARQLWGYIRTEAMARAFLAGVTADFEGHEPLYIVAPDTMMETPSLDLAAEYYPDVEVRGDLSGNRGFFDCSRAREVLGWEHDDRTDAEGTA